MIRPGSLHPAVDRFIQRDPKENEPATERTEARILHDDHALYVGIRAHESEPERIVGQLTRRDEWSQSDWLTVSFDSFGDRRTAFDFQVNPAGVERDVYRYDDTSEDVAWDAVWEVATEVDGSGWTAEFRIPFSQLRFAAARERPWGLQISRDIARKNEFDLWKPIAKDLDRWVSEYGDLAGLDQVTPPRRLELLPYTVGGGRTFPTDPTNQFADGTEMLARMGLDLKYGITSDMTLDATFNPDFGQVEADPSVINLSEFETFFPEKRPFFLEGVDKFQYSLALGDGVAESLFYTRRIGRGPQGGASGYYIDSPLNTTIMGAGKVSGKNAGGWTLGVLEAITQEEVAEIVSEEGGESQTVIEPLTSYAVGRVARDFREGETAFGGILTATNRRPRGHGHGLAPLRGLHGGWRRAPPLQFTGVVRERQARLLPRARRSRCAPPHSAELTALLPAPGCEPHRARFERHLALRHLRRARGRQIRRHLARSAHEPGTDPGPRDQ